MSLTKAKGILDSFLLADVSTEARHQRRIQKINTYEK
jgi:ribose 5-phosphate isomerase RpiB